MRHKRMKIRVPRWAGRSLAAVLAAILAATVIGPSAATGRDSSALRGDDIPLAAGIGPATVGKAVFDGVVPPRLDAAEGDVTAFVELATKAGVDAFNAEQDKGSGTEEARSAAITAKADTDVAVESVVGQLKAADSGARLVARTSNAVAGAVVTADAAEIRLLAKRPDVVSVRTVVPKKRTNASADQLTNALAYWQQTGRFGEGLRVGVIDDGVDYTHADFGGPGTPGAYAANDPAKIEPSSFPTGKVAGGVDLVGDDYDSAGKTGSATPKPDPDPLACGEHGTHVAGTIAGAGVNADGSTFTGDYAKLDAAQVDALKIGPGAAPKASLYAIKVFGCQGSTDVTSQALDWALDPDGDGDFSDHLDVVNLSLGSDFGAPDDPDALFVRKLAANNVLPVLSAGNGGDVFDIAGSPGNTPEALTVASSRDASILRNAIAVTAPADAAGKKGGQFSSVYGDYATLDKTGPVTKLPAANADGCAVFSESDKAAVTGRFVWLEWDDDDARRACGSVVRADNAEAAGAAGVLLSSTLDDFAAGISGNAKVPMFQLTGTATKELRPALDSGTLQVQFAGAGRTGLQTYDESIVDSPSSFSSRGVRGPAMKPDVSAPGDTIASALRGSGNDRTVLSGTSMAAPHVAGIAALIREAHPDWSVEEVKASVINTAGHDLKNAAGVAYAPQRVGSGRIDAKAALDNSVLAYVSDNPGAVGVNFGTVEAAGPVSLSKNVKIVNKGAKPVEYSVTYQGTDRLPGVAYQLDRTKVSLSPRGVATVKVTLQITDPKALRKVIDPTMDAEQAGLARQFLADASGLVVLSPVTAGPSAADTTVDLRVPVYSAPKPVSAISAPTAVDFAEGAAQSVLKLTGEGVDQGSGAQRYRSLVSVFELQARSDRLPECGGPTTERCTLNNSAKGGDLQYVGAASTAPLAMAGGEPKKAMFAVGLSTWSDWANLGSNTVPFVDIDTTGDGRPDFEMFVTKAPGTDVLLVKTIDVAKANKPTVDTQAVNGQLGDLDTNVFDTNVVVLPVRVEALGIDPEAGSHRISYTVGTVGYYTPPGSTNGLIDAVSTPLSFDVLAPGYAVHGTGETALSYTAKPGTALTVTRDAASAANDTVLGLLVLQHHNASGSRAAVVELAPPAQP
jgi:subtilisin family serine protease